MKEDSARDERDRLRKARAAAGRKGGLTTLRRHGTGFFRQIGKRGGTRSTGAKHAR